LRRPTHSPARAHAIPKSQANHKHAAKQ